MHARRHGGAAELSFADELEKANEKKYVEHVDEQLKEEASSGLAMMARSGGGATCMHGTTHEDGGQA